MNTFIQPTREECQSTEPCNYPDIPDGLFIGGYPAGLVFCDRERLVYGDYMKVAFISYDLLSLTIYEDIPQEYREYIKASHQNMKSRIDDQYQTTASGQTVTLGNSI